MQASMSSGLKSHLSQWQPLSLTPLPTADIPDLGPPSHQWKPEHRSTKRSKEIRQQHRHGVWKRFTSSPWHQAGWNSEVHATLRRGSHVVLGAQLHRSCELFCLCSLKPCITVPGSPGLSCLPLSKPLQRIRQANPGMQRIQACRL